MERLIVADSCLELNDRMLETMNIKQVPFFIDIEKDHYIDDGSIDQREFLGQMKKSSTTPKTAAPTPNVFYDAMKGADEVFVVTISSKLSVTYNNAIIAAKMALEENPDLKVHVFDSKSAMTGETLVALKIQELIDLDKDFGHITREVEAYIESMNTLFVLEDLDNLIKNGRMSKIAGFVASALSIVPVCGAEDGEIIVINKSRGMKAAMKNLVSLVGERGEIFSDKTMVISHVDNILVAEDLKQKILAKYNFKDIQIVGAKGLSSTYANKGGIVVSY